MISQEELDKIFKYSAPNDKHKEKFSTLTGLWQHVAQIINELCPDSREKSLAITKLDECRFFANAAIVRRDDWEV
jgi:hypothetical protein